MSKFQKEVDEYKKQIEQTDNETEAIEMAGQLTASQYTSVQRFTRAMSRSRPAWDAHAEEGMAAWVARFKWEFPWRVEFEVLTQDSLERQAFTAIPTVEDMMAEMSKTEK